MRIFLLNGKEINDFNEINNLIHENKSFFITEIAAYNLLVSDMKNKLMLNKKSYKIHFISKMFSRLIRLMLYNIVSFFVNTFLFIFISNTDSLKNMYSPILYTSVLILFCIYFIKIVYFIKIDYDIVFNLNLSSAEFICNTSNE